MQLELELPVKSLVSVNILFKLTIIRFTIILYSHGVAVDYVLDTLMQWKIDNAKYNLIVRSYYLTKSSKLSCLFFLNPGHTRV